MALTLHLAERVIDAVLAAGVAADMKPLGVAVLDTGGNIVAFKRQDGATFLRYAIAFLSASALGFHIKKRRMDPAAVLPDRSRVTMTTPFMRAYCLHVIEVCHRRGAHALGGMAAQIPIKDDPTANEQAFAKVRADKEREVHDGHDGTWVAHPGLVPVATDIFDAFMPGPNQVSRQLDAVSVGADDLLAPHPDLRTIEGLRTNIDVSVRYVDRHWSGWRSPPPSRASNRCVVPF